MVSWGRVATVTPTTFTTLSNQVRGLTHDVSNHLSPTIRVGNRHLRTNWNVDVLWRPVDTPLFLTLAVATSLDIDGAVELQVKESI